VYSDGARSAGIDSMSLMKSICFVGLLACFTLPAGGETNGLFGFDTLKSNICVLASRPYTPPPPLPRKLQALDYDDLRNIRFEPRHAVWRMERLPFQLQFFHPGGIRQDCVKINLIEGELITPVEFSRDMFVYENVKIRGNIPEDIGFSGFRVHYPLNRPDYLDELIVFQGATYFRALGRGHRYGISARTLALHVADEEDEEFPRYREFWIEKPDRSADRIKIYGLFESSNIVGAAEFVVIPGAGTTIHVRVALAARQAVTNYGVAPLTSMFWYDESAQWRYNDFRSEVHDSDGVAVHTGSDEWLWRPLVNGAKLRFGSFIDNNIRGFGMMQRDRQFSNYEDLESYYHLRPSVWIEPKGGWGEGNLRLVEFPTTVEYADNIVSFWQPLRPLQPGELAQFDYKMRWLSDDPDIPPKGRVIATRCAGISYNPAARRFILDFGGHELTDESLADAIEADVSAQNGKVLGHFIQRNEYIRGWRVFFDVEPVSPAQPVEMRCFIKNDTHPLSETWTYQWIP